MLSENVQICVTSFLNSPLILISVNGWHANGSGVERVLTSATPLAQLTAPPTSRLPRSQPSHTKISQLESITLNYVFSKFLQY